LARQIADRWKRLDNATRSYFDTYAELDMKRYKDQVEEWKKLKDDELCGGLDAATVQQQNKAQKQQRELDLLLAQYDKTSAKGSCNRSDGSNLESKQKGMMERRNALPPTVNSGCNIGVPNPPPTQSCSNMIYPSTKLTSGGIEPIPLSEIDDSDGDDLLMTPSCGKIVRRLFANDIMEAVERPRTHCLEPAMALSRYYCSVPDVDYPGTPRTSSAASSAAIAITTPDTPESSNKLAKFLEHLDFNAL
jgi:hypothetical protein